MGAGVHQWATCLHDGCVDAKLLDNLYDYVAIEVVHWYGSDSEGRLKAEAHAWRIAKKTGIPIYTEFEP